MEGYNKAALQIQEVGQHPVRQLRGQDLQEGRRAVGPADLEPLLMGKGKAVRGDEVLGGEAGLVDGVP